MFKDTNSYGVVYIQFLCALGIFFGLCNYRIAQEPFM